MSRLLILLALVTIAYYAYRRLMIRHLAPPAEKPVRKLDMVRCEYCDIHLPAHESFACGEHHYCSDEHLKLGRSKDC